MYDHLASQRSRKDTRDVSFPLVDLDLGRYASGEGGAGPLEFMYDCRAIVQHIGSDLLSGHYMACVKGLDDRRCGVW